MYFILRLFISNGRGFLISDWLFIGFLHFHLGKEVNYLSLCLKSNSGSAHIPYGGVWSDPSTACAALAHRQGLSGLCECPGPQVCRGMLCPSFPSNTLGLHKLELCCSGVYVTFDKLMLFLEYCRPTVHYRNSKEYIPIYKPFKIM